MRRSIRWELPLSYAAIALLAAVALGVILLLVLGSHYGRLERLYLSGNALAFSYSLAPMLEDGLPDESLQAQLTSLSFLSQSRVRVLDPDGVPLADSSTPGGFAVSLARLPERWVVVLERGPEADARDRPFTAIEPGLLEPAESALAETLFPPLGVGSLRTRDPYAPFRIRTLPHAGPGFPTVGSDADPDGPRSDQVVLQPIYDGEANLLGYVEVSEGLAYRQEIVASVASGWLLASAAAVALAAIVGWLVSRRISEPLLTLTAATTSMAGGDLAVRAQVRSRDEFGTLARSFNAMADRVEDTVAGLRRFVSDAAHEIHTPLTALHTNLELAREDSGLLDESVEALDEHLSGAQAQAKRLQSLTDGLLDLSRLESGAGARGNAPVPLVPVVQDLGEICASQGEQAGLDFDLSIEDTPIAVLGDEAQLSRALSNLLDNAIKFTPEGGTVCLGLCHRRESAVIWVEDTGIGVAGDDLPHLFERFHRGRNATGYPGSGLGLAIVKAIVEGHGGRVEAERTALGVRFNVMLPIAGPEGEQVSDEL